MLVCSLVSGMSRPAWGPASTLTEGLGGGGGGAGDAASTASDRMAPCTLLGPRDLADPVSPLAVALTCVRPPLRLDRVTALATCTCSPRSPAAARMPRVEYRELTTSFSSTQ